MSEPSHTFGDGALRVVVAARGAELQSLHDVRFGELLWQAGPAWPRRSPVLFPIVGRLAGDALRAHGVEHAMSQHGFARDATFRWLARDETGCRLELEDDAATRVAYPWRFRLEIAYAAADGALHATYRLSNPGEATLPACLGAHPGFRWPLADGEPREAHRLEFAADEPAPVRRLAGGLLDPRPRPTPIQDRVLPLSRALFAEDALILDRPASRSLRYVAPGALALEIAWEGFTELGLWTKPDAGDFLCIEPWRGHADPVGFTGAFADKPGVMHLAPGEAVDLAWSVRPLAA